MGERRLLGAETGLATATAAWRLLPRLLLLLLQLRLPATSAADAVNEGAILRKLRQAVYDQDVLWADGLAGWTPDDPVPPCRWEEVHCNIGGHVTTIFLWNMFKSAARRHPNPPPPSPPPNKTTTTTTTTTTTPSSSDGCSGGGASLPGPLLPELAQLPWLEELDIGHTAMLLRGGIPAAWGAPGAFPQLKRLLLSFPGLTHCALPDIHPGALPRLLSLDLTLAGLHATLPPSWGGRPDVLPALQVLTVRVAAVDRLPAQWSRGFRQLVSLVVDGSVLTQQHVVHAARGGGGGGAAGGLVLPTPVLAAPLPAQTPPSPPAWPVLPKPAETAAAVHLPAEAAAAAHPPAEAAAAAAAVHLPAEWAFGFPVLEELSLGGLEIAGSLPRSWLIGGFPALQTLALPFNRLVGTVPWQLFNHRPGLTSVSLASNQFSGPLPDAWAATQVAVVGVEHNMLTGPAFPPAWLRPGAMDHLGSLRLLGNPGLVGALPANLSWPAIKDILLEGTGVEGSIPPSWCHAPFAQGLQSLHINNTAVPPTPPPCAARYMPYLRLDDGQHGTAHAAGTAPQQQQQQQQEQNQQRRRLATSVLAALLPLGAMLGAAAVVRVLWRRRMQLRHALDRDSQDAQGLLQAQQQQQGSVAGAGSWAAASAQKGSVLQAGPGVGAGVQGIRNRRARLAALLVGGDDGSGRGGHGGGEGSGGIEMLPLGPLPVPLVHRLRLAGKAGQGRPRPLVGDVAGGLEDSRTAAGFGSPPASRQWGLATESLRLAAGELQFVVNAADGCVRCLGEGSSGVVYLALLHGQQVAVKVFELEAGMDGQTVWREVLLMQQCTHERIVPLYGVTLKGPVLALVMHYMEGGSLRGALQQPGMREELRWENRGRQVAVDVAEALAHMHTRLNILHGDLKASNVLLCHDCRACVSDLGLGQMMASCSRAHLGFTRAYAAPEQLMGQRCTLAADLYSFGVVLMELATQQVVSSRGEWRLPHAPHECPQGVVDLIQDCLRPDPTSRPTAAQALQRLQEAGSRHGRRSPSFSAG